MKIFELEIAKDQCDERFIAIQKFFLFFEDAKEI